MVRDTEIRFFMPEIWRTFNHCIAKIVNFYMVSLAQWETIHHKPSKCQPSGGWFGGRETPELWGEGCSMVWTDSDCAWPLFHIKNANIRNPTGYIGTLFWFGTLIVGCILEVKRVKCWTAWSETPPEFIFGDVRRRKLWKCDEIQFTVQSGIPPWKPIDRVPSNHRVFPSKLEVPNKDSHVSAYFYTLTPFPEPAQMLGLAGSVVPSPAFLWGSTAMATSWFLENVDIYPLVKALLSLPPPPNWIFPRHICL